MHLVFKLCLTRRQLCEFYDGLLLYIRKKCAKVADIIEGTGQWGGGSVSTTFTDSLMEDAGEYMALVGLDSHALKNLEQGLALPFSQKSHNDTPSRLMRIIHVKGGVEYMSEVLTCPGRTSFR